MEQQYEAMSKLAAACLALLDLAAEPGYREIADDARQGIVLVMLKIRRDEAEREGPPLEEAGLEA